MRRSQRFEPRCLPRKISANEIFRRLQAHWKSVFPADGPELEKVRIAETARNIFEVSRSRWPSDKASCEDARAWCVRWTVRAADSASDRSTGDDPGRDGLVRTPERVEKALRFLTSGYHTDIRQIVNGALLRVKYDEMVIVKDIEFFSLCEHHMLPFFGKIHVAYLPKGQGDRSEQNSAHRRCFRPPAADSGAHDAGGRAKHPGDARSRSAWA